MPPVAVCPPLVSRLDLHNCVFALGNAFPRRLGIALDGKDLRVLYALTIADITDHGLWAPQARLVH
ncbi:MAG: hypothetical protein JO029_10495, partial [Candidatus Eremiobacteraeota bacterium]|nr:hypothetical protein [Candidatus Eremiobacteraeota bacterium]